MNSKFLKIVLSGSLVIGATPSFAATSMRTSEDLKLGASSDDGAVREQSSGEICIKPQRFDLRFGKEGSEKSLNDFSSKDDKSENKLCGIDFGVQPICPKLNSTNPGVLVIDSKDGNKDAMTADVCKNKKINGQKLSVDAKFKQSITCSYSPSALAAYHLSRMMGSQLKTPVAVVKTMPTRQHQEISALALKILTNPAEIIYKTWSQFKNADASASDPKLYVDSGNFLFGALSENIKHENIYTEVSGVGPYETRYQRFAEQVPFKRVADSRGILEILGNSGANNFKVSYPVIQQMKDVSNMIVLDTLLSQDDRIGNIHFRFAYAAPNLKGKVESERLSKMDLAGLEKLIGNNKPSKLTETQVASFTSDFLNEATDIKKEEKFFEAGETEDSPSFNDRGVLVREMVLKDNDCGVDVDKRSNQMRKIGAIESVRHMTLKTYRAILALYRESQGQDLEKFFINTLLYRSEDFNRPKGFKDNLKKVYDVVIANCKSQLLKLDLSGDYVNGVYTPSANICE